MRRRDVLRWLGFTALAGSAIGPLGGAGALAQANHVSGAPSGRGLANSAFVPDVEIALRAAPSEARILPGAATRVWRFTGELLKGPTSSLQQLPDSYLGPVIRVRTGQRVRIRFSHTLPEPSIVHWHGLDVPEAADGHPRFSVGPGREYVYEFQVTNRAGMYWYHPHQHERTGPQVYQGLAGLFIVTDDVEAALGLPSGTEEVLCVLQDRTFDTSNQLVYLSGMHMEQMGGFLGAKVLVNGRQPEPLELGTKAYRFRILNGSNSRAYKLAWSDGTPMTLVGTDGGLLEKPHLHPYLTLAVGERVDVLLDLSRQSVGAVLHLQSLAFPTAPFAMGMGRGMGRGGMGGGGGAVPANGAPLSILPVRVARRETSRFTLPATLSAFDAEWHHGATFPPTASRVVKVEFRQMQWMLNGGLFEMDGVLPEDTVAAGSTSVWEFDNAGPSMMGMRLAHPLHVHGRQFRVVDRQIEPSLRADWQAVRDGFTDEGWKDTVLVMPGERVRIVVRFTQYPGLYLYHCHNLEHEDMGMMRNLRVVS